MGKRRRDRTHEQTFHSKEPSSSEIEDSANLPDPDIIAAEIDSRCSQLNRCYGKLT